MPALMDARERSPPPRLAGRSGPSRLVVIDALRGLALALMALEHCSVYARVDTVAEHYAGRIITPWRWPFWTTGLVTNMAAPAFWFVAGVSVALYEAAHRRRRDSEWAITRFFLVRAGVLIALDLAVIATIRGLATGQAYRYQFDVLTSMGVSLVLLAVLRLLPSWALALISLSVLASYQWILSAARPHLAGMEHGRFWLSLWLEYTKQTSPVINFPVLGWWSLMGLGVVLGRRLDAPALQRPGTHAAAGAGLLGAWLLIRSCGGYGSFFPYDPGTPWYFFLMMSKGPPSLDFMLFNLGLAALAMALLTQVKDASTARRSAGLSSAGRRRSVFTCSTTRSTRSCPSCFQPSCRSGA